MTKEVAQADQDGGESDQPGQPAALAPPEPGLLPGREEHGPRLAGGVLQELHRRQHREPYVLLTELSSKLSSGNQVLQVQSFPNFGKTHVSVLLRFTANIICSYPVFEATIEYFYQSQVQLWPGLVSNCFGDLNHDDNAFSIIVDGGVGKRWRQLCEGRHKKNRLFLGKSPKLWVGGGQES